MTAGFLASLTKYRNMTKVLVAFCSLLVLLGALSGVQGRLFDNPQTVTYLSAEVTREGSITLIGTGPGAMASSLEIWQTIPQGTGRQTSQLMEITGPDSHRFGTDEFGNEILILEWDNPPVDVMLDYSIMFEVNVRDSDDHAFGTDFPLTRLTEPTQAITESAYDLAGGLTTRKKFMELTSFVYTLVEYDDTYQNVQKSADWVFRNQRAVCDGHANLLVSMLRSLGYNAYYVIGYAYTEVGVDPGNPNYWGPHGWVEVEHDGTAYSLDPTWMEAPVDATHVKFAVAPDSNYTEYVQIMAHNVKVNWDKGDYFITMLDYLEGPKVEISGRVINPKPSSGESSVIITDVSSIDECAIIELEFSSCSSNGKPFFEPVPASRQVGLCGEETMYWVIRAPDLEPGVEYTCGVSVTGSGARYNTSLTAYHEQDFIKTMISTQNVHTPGEFFSTNTTVENTGLAREDLELFMVLDDYVQHHEVSVGGMQAMDLVWTMKAPKKEGRYTMMFLDSSGGLLEEEVTVVGNRVVEIADLELPDNISIDDILYLNVTLRGLENSTGEIEVSIGEYREGRDFLVRKGEEKTFTFIYQPGSEGTKHVSIVVLTGEEQYQDGIVDNIQVTRDLGWLEYILAAIREALESLFRALGMST